MLDLPQFIRAEAKRAEFFAELVKRIDTVANLETAEAESRAKIEANRAEAERILAEAQTRQEMAAAAVSDARLHVLAFTDQAKQDAEQIKAKSAAEGAEILNAAKDAAAEAKKREQFSEAEERRAKKRLEGLLAQIAEAEPKLAEAKATIARAEGIAAALKG